MTCVGIGGNFVILSLYSVFSMILMWLIVSVFPDAISITVLAMTLIVCVIANVFGVLLLKGSKEVRIRL